MEAKRRLTELQRVQEEQLRRKDLRDRYVQAMRTRGTLDRTQSREGRDVQALDLEMGRGKAGVGDLQKREIQGSDKGKAEVLWEKGDLLDSLDLSSTKLKDKIGKLPSQAALDTQPKQSEEPKAWLHNSIRQSIKEWAPNSLKENSIPSVPTPKPTPTQALSPAPTKPLPPPPKKSKKVTELRGKVQRLRQNEVLSTELQQIEMEERKMMESIDRLDLALGSHQVVSKHLVDYMSKPRPKNNSKEVEEVMVQDSIAKLSEILERRSEAGTDVGSVVSAPYSACSAPIAAVTKIKSNPYIRANAYESHSRRLKERQDAKR